VHRITEKSALFKRYIHLAAEIQAFNPINDYTKYKIFEESNAIIVKYANFVSFSLYELEGNVSKDEALELLENIGVFTSDIYLMDSLN
jgi:hypothetical protein